MRNTKPLVTLVASSFLALSVSAAAYIRFDGVDGESAASDHKKWVDLESVAFAFQRVADPATGQIGRAVPKDFTITKKTDASSPKLMEAVATGMTIPSVTFHLTRARPGGGEETYYTYELKNVLVTSFSVQGGGSAEGDSRPKESMSLNYEEIKVTYVVEFDVNGRPSSTVETTWRPGGTATTGAN